MTRYSPPSDADNMLQRDSESGIGLPALSLDWEEFAHFLDDTGWTEGQKAEYVTLVWNIVGEFVALGWGVHPLQQAEETCGKVPEPGSNEALPSSEVVELSHSDLISKFFRLKGEFGSSGQKGVEND